MKGINSAGQWLLIVVALAVGAVIGSTFKSRANENEMNLLLVMDQTSKVRLHANMIRQLSRGDLAGSEAAHREVIASALAAIDVVAASDPNYANSSEVSEAKRLAAEVGVVTP